MFLLALEGTSGKVTATVIIPGFPKPWGTQDQVWGIYIYDMSVSVYPPGKLLGVQALVPTLL